MKPSSSPLPNADGAEPRHRLGGHRRPAGTRRSWRSGRLDFAPRPLALEDRRQSGPAVFREQRKRIELGTIFAAVIALGTIALVWVLAYRATRVDVEHHGIDDGAVLTGEEAAALEVRLVFASADDAREAALRVDGTRVEEPQVSGDTMLWRPAAPLSEGEHVLSLSVPRPVLDDAELAWRFTVDVTPPTLDVPPVVEPVAMDAPAAVSGTAEPGATVRADGDDVDVDRDGGFRLDYRRAPAGPIVLEARDRAGNVTTASVSVPVTYPSLRGVHVSAAAWGSDKLRAHVLQLAAEGRIDTVQLDLKDDQGVVGYDTGVERAHQIGAVTPYYDLDRAVATLRDHGVRVIGRIVAFRDPIFAQAALGGGHPDHVIQSTSGGPWGGRAQYTNLAHPDVRRYNLDLALEAVARGVDDILWDDVRLPVGDPAGMVVPGLAGSVSDSVAGFLAQTHTELRRRGAYQGVSADGEATERGPLVGQDVARLAANADYVAPQIFPGYWSAGRYDVASPIRQPGDLVSKVLQRFQQASAGRGAVLAPWLQDFTIGGVPYGEAELRAQIAAADALGVDRFLLWDPAVTYTGTALDPVSPASPDRPAG